MITFNESFLNLEYELIQVFMVKAKPYLLEVSFEKFDSILNIRVVWEEGQLFPKEEYVKKVIRSLPDLEKIDIDVVYITRSKFTIRNNGEPMFHKAWKHLLFSKYYRVL